MISPKKKTRSILLLKNLKANKYKLTQKIHPTKSQKNSHNLKMKINKNKLKF
jgi:hypothetical protein